MNIDEIAYDIYLDDNVKYPFKSITFDVFIKCKNLYDKYYKQALIIERQNKIKQLYEH